MTSRILPGPSQNQNPTFAPTNSSTFYSAENSQKNVNLIEPPILPEPSICSLFAQEIAKMPHFVRQEKNLARETLNAIQNGTSR